jgi:hypothetical protein
VRDWSTDPLPPEQAPESTSTSVSTQTKRGTSTRALDLKSISYQLRVGDCTRCCPNLEFKAWAAWQSTTTDTDSVSPAHLILWRRVPRGKPCPCSRQWERLRPPTLCCERDVAPHAGWVEAEQARVLLALRSFYSPLLQVTCLSSHGPPCRNRPPALAHHSQRAVAMYDLAL